MTKQIQLTQGQVALVDDADYEWLNQWKWCASRAGNKFYATRNDYNGQNNIVRMHNVIMGSSDGMDVDHKNGNGLDNRRKNLRICTRGDNVRNRKKPRVNDYPYIGIQPSGKKWRSYIGHAGQVIYLGTYLTPEEAARAYDEAAKSYFGEYANLNFP